MVDVDVPPAITHTPTGRSEICGSLQQAILDRLAEMAEDPNVVSKSAILQSVTAEANGFYGVIVIVASTFLGGSLLFLEKFAPARSGWSIVVISVGWTALVASIGCVARVRFMNLRSGKLALEDKHDEASQIDRHTDALSNWSQWLLIFGMSALVVMGVLNFNQISKNERKQTISNQNTDLRESLPYGSLKPSIAGPQVPPQNVPAPVSHTTEKK